VDIGESDKLKDNQYYCPYFQCGSFYFFPELAQCKVAKIKMSSVSQDHQHSAPAAFSRTPEADLSSKRLGGPNSLSRKEFNE